MKAEVSINNSEKFITLRQLREQLINVLILSSFIIGTVLFLIALIPAIRLGLTFIIAIYCIVYIGLGIITFLPRLGFFPRLASWLAFFYILGMINLVMNGLNVDAGLFFLTLIAMAAILDGLRSGLISLIVTTITVSITGYLFVSHPAPLIMGLSQHNSLLWVIGGFILLFMGALLTITSNKIIRGLESSIEKSTGLAEELTQANLVLRQSEERYRMLVEKSPNLVVLLDPDGHILMANQPGLMLFQYDSINEAIGKNILDFVAIQDREWIVKRFQEAEGTGSIETIECLALRKDGSTFFAEIDADWVISPDGARQSIIGIGKDITRRRLNEQALLDAKDLLARKVQETSEQLHQTTNRLSELVAHSPTVIYSRAASGSGGITYVSENVKAVLGFTPKEFIETAF